MTKLVISVIVPIYNVEKYLKECLDSIANQTMINNLEVILVDDGSTDNSRYIVDEYALDYDNFHAYHKSNGGLGNARNFGLQFAKGEYVYFIDSDDILPSNALEKLYIVAKKYGHDIVCGNFIRFNEDSIWKEEVMEMIFQDINHDIESTHFKEYPNLVWDVGVWNKIFKRDFLEKNGLRFPDKGLHEDNIFSTKSYYLSKSIGIIKDYVYFWRLRENSITTRRVTPQDLADRVHMLNDVYQFMNSNIQEENVKKMIFHKFLNMDFKVVAHQIINNEIKYCKEIDGLIKIIELIPDESINELHTYRRLLVRMLENKDFENMHYLTNNYSKLIDISEQETMRNIDESYTQYFNIKHDLEIAKLTANTYKIDHDDEKITLFVFIYRSLCPAHDYEIKAKLISKEGLIELEVVRNKEIIVPIDLIGDDNSKIKIEYSYDDTYIEMYAQYKYDTVLDYGNFDINLSSGIDRQLNISKREKNHNKIIINNIMYEGNRIFLTGKSCSPVSLFLENIIDFEKVDIKTEFKSDNEFVSTLNYKDLIHQPVKKWKFKADLFNSIQLLEDNQSIYFNIHKISFYNKFNEISIECRLYDTMDTINSLNEKLFIAERKNKMLSSKNRKLRKTIEAYKSRKTVKFADKLKGFF